MLLEAITDMSEPGTLIPVRYQTLKDEYGDMIFHGRHGKQPQRALESLKADLLARGIKLESIGKLVRERKTEDGKPGKSGKGFVISCMNTPEEMTGALPK